MKGINKTAIIVTKIMEVGHWVAAGLMTLLGIFSCFAPRLIKYVTDVEQIKNEKELSAYGFSVCAANEAGEINYTTLCLFAVGSVIIFVIMALIFNNLNLIIRRSENSTPFSKDNIKSLKMIGRLCIIVPLVAFVMSVIIRLVIGVDATEISMDQSGVIMGIIVLCLTEYFIHGAELENDVDGLV